MTFTEQRLEALMRFAVAENESEQKKARKEIRQMLAREPERVNWEPEVADRNVEAGVRRILLDLGVPEHILGHGYLVTAICAAVRKPELLRAIHKGLYALVAEAYNATPPRVERAIRHAIETAWERCDYDVLIGYFGNTIDPDKAKPTNGEFIARVSNIVRGELMCNA